jgi:hypothetical protein
MEKYFFSGVNEGLDAVPFFLGGAQPGLRNTRKTVAVSGAPPKGLASSFLPWRRAAAPFARLSRGSVERPQMAGLN